MIIKLLCALKAAVNSTLIEVIFGSKAQYPLARLIFKRTLSALRKINLTHRTRRFGIGKRKKSHHIVDSEKLRRIRIVFRHSAHPCICVKGCDIGFVKAESGIFSEHIRRFIASKPRANHISIFVHGIPSVCCAAFVCFRKNATQYFINAFFNATLFFLRRVFVIL